MARGGRWRGRFWNVPLLASIQAQLSLKFIGTKIGAKWHLETTKNQGISGDIRIAENRA
jgi:hypothetical protein